MPLRIGVDTGGTFTDIVMYDTRTGRQVEWKETSTPDDPSRAIATGVARARELLASGEPTERLVHGTTVATNALLERRGARTALITTASFRDLLAIGRQNRPALYDLRARRPSPLIPRRLRWEVHERVRHDGTVARSPDTDEVERIIDRLESENIEAVVVGLLFSHVNPAHELAIAAQIRKRLPNLAVTMSHAMASVPGELERLSTAAVNAFVQPVMAAYLRQLESTIAKGGAGTGVLVMKSSGGVGLASLVAEKCVETVLSGPAGGVMACARLALATGQKNLIAADMGGTSFDVAVITGGEPARARDTQIGGLPLRTPMLDLHTVGAGGGSIAWIDAGGALRVGPQSAGATPGPVCFARGGDLPTVTDANLVLGRLAPASRLAGGMALDLAAAGAAIGRHLATPLGLTIQQAAHGVLRVVNTAMVAAIRRLTIERGVDPRGYTLCAYGGAGPLHGAELMAELGGSQVVVPRAPGVFSAAGLLGCDLREDRMATHIERLRGTDVAALDQRFAQLLDDAGAALVDAAAGHDVQYQRTLGLRYVGQSSEIAIGVSDGVKSTDALTAEFTKAHEQLFGFAPPDHEIEIASLWATVRVTIDPPPRQAIATTRETVEPTTQRRVVFGDGVHATAIYDRENMYPSVKIRGPAIVEQDDTTTVIPPDWSGEVDEFGNLVLGKNPFTDGTMA